MNRSRNLRSLQVALLLLGALLSSGTSDAAYNACPGDLDLDGTVGFADLSRVLNCWGPGTGGCWEQDLDYDGNIGFAELTILLSSWGDCPIPRNHVIGDQKIAVVLLDYDHVGNEQPADEIESGMFESPKSIKRFVEEVSYGKATISGDVYGWYPVIDDISDLPLLGQGLCYPPAHMMPNWLAERGVDVEAYDGLVIVTNYSFTGSCTYGHSTLGKRTYGFTNMNGEWTHHGMFISMVRTAFLSNGDYSRTTNSTMAHELLHGFGIPLHADALVCEGETIGLDMAHCSLGNGWDQFAMMGLRTMASHPSMARKHDFGWLGEGDQVIVTESGQYTLSAREKLSVTAPRALRIQLPEPVDTPSNYNHKIRELVLEYSGRTGFDFRTDYYSEIRQSDGSYYQIPDMYGVQIRGVDSQIPEHPGYSDTFLIDATPASNDPDYPPHQFNDALLVEGATFVEPYNGIQIHVDAVDLSSATVTISF